MSFSHRHYRRKCEPPPTVDIEIADLQILAGAAALVACLREGASVGVVHHKFVISVGPNGLFVDKNFVAVKNDFPDLPDHQIPIVGPKRDITLVGVELIRHLGKRFLRVAVEIDRYDVGGVGFTPARGEQNAANGGNEGKIPVTHQVFVQMVLVVKDTKNS
jgi:hypothetical protein